MRKLENVIYKWQNEDELKTLSPLSKPVTGATTVFQETSDVIPAPPDLAVSFFRNCYVQNEYFFSELSKNLLFLDQKIILHFAVLKLYVFSGHFVLNFGKSKIPKRKTELESHSVFSMRIFPKLYCFLIRIWAPLSAKTICAKSARDWITHKPLG